MPHRRLADLTYLGTNGRVDARRQGDGHLKHTRAFDELPRTPGIEDKLGRTTIATLPFDLTYIADIH